MARLPAHLDVMGLIRQVQSAGGFATVIAKGERTGGAILVILREKDANLRAYERHPSLDDELSWSVVKVQDTENKEQFDEYLDCRKGQDPDLWIVELDIPRGERFIGLPGTAC